MDIYHSAPLAEVADHQLKDLYCVLWDWKSCTACTGSVSCSAPGCPTRRAERLGPFREFYKHITSAYVPEFSASGQVALRSHDDLTDIIRHVKQQPSFQRRLLVESYFSERAKREGCQTAPSRLDQERAFNTAVRILTMISCSAENQTGALLESGTQPITWSNNDSLTKFVTKSFPTTDHPSLNDASQAGKAATLKSSLEGKRLSKIARLSFRPTNDLANHLRLDADGGYVEIFHHTRVLKEYLISTKEERGKEDQPGYPREGFIPRRLALEVIDTIQKILFPLESDSESLLRSLVVKHGFDPDCLRLVESTPYRRPDEHDIPYHFFGGRLMDLAQESESPTPRTLVEKWLERKSGARYVMLATLAGVAVAIILGFLSLVVGILQAWISWQAWKYPSVSGGN